MNCAYEKDLKGLHHKTIVCTDPICQYYFEFLVQTNKRISAAYFVDFMMLFCFIFSKLTKKFYANNKHRR